MCHYNELTPVKHILLCTGINKLPLTTALDMHHDNYIWLSTTHSLSYVSGYQQPHAVVLPWGLFFYVVNLFRFCKNGSHYFYVVIAVRRANAVSMSCKGTVLFDLFVLIMSQSTLFQAYWDRSSSVELVQYLTQNALLGYFFKNQDPSRYTHVKYQGSKPSSSML